jgi:hypothetical protein
MAKASTLETVLDVCGHKHRRIVLAALASQQQSISVNDLADAIIKHNHHTPPTEADDETIKRIYIGLHQVHLPKLADTGFIQYDAERKVVEPTTQVGREESYLSTILAMDSELPVS